MISKWRWLLRQFTRRLWARVTLLSLLSVATAVLAIVWRPEVPADLSKRIGADAVDQLLGILASSMLAVTTFSLNIMVSAYGAATSNVTPRATRLLMQDATTQNVLSVFMGSFIFSLVGLIALSIGAYGDSGRVILFFVTIGFVALIVVTILRWIDHLTRFGRVGETTRRVEEAAAAALAERIAHPGLGASLLTDPRRIPEAARSVTATSAGYVQHVDIGALADIAEDCEAELFLVAAPGAFVHPGAPLVRLAGVAKEPEAVEAAVREAFAIGDERSFDQDPRFGLSVLSEIASRALSPAVNDPGTAIDVIGRAVRILERWRDGAPQEEVEPRLGRVHVAPLSIDDLFDDIFTPIARDGAGLIEVQLRLQKALRALAGMDVAVYGRAARAHSAFALERAEAALTSQEDKRRLRAAALAGEPG